MFVGGHSEMSGHFYFFNVKYLQITYFITTFAVGFPGYSQRMFFFAGKQKRLKV
jgi:hypothetical protein